MAVETKKFDIGAFVESAERRNSIIFPYVLKEDKQGDSKVYWQAQWHKGMVAQLILYAFVAKIKIRGVDNLFEAAALSEEIIKDKQKEEDGDAQEKNEVILVSNHISDLDHSVKRFIFSKLGLNGFAKQLVYPSGLKMIERPQIRPFIPGENVLFVMTPFDAQDLEEAKKAYPELSKAQQEIIDKYEDNFKSLSRESARKRHELRKQGKVFVSYPESTRSVDGLLLPGQEAVTSHYPKNKEDAYLVPMMFDGVNIINPPRRKFHPARIEIKMTVGKPYPVKDIWRKEIDADKVMRKEAMDRVMARLVILEPELVSPQDRKYYAKFLMGYDPNIKSDYQFI